MTAERFDPVDEPVQPGAGAGIGCADAVVGDAERESVALESDHDGYPRRLRVLRGVGEAFGDDEIHGRFGDARFPPLEFDHRFDGYAAVLIELPRVTKRAMREALLDGWLACAPRRLSDEHLARSYPRRRS